MLRFALALTLLAPHGAAQRGGVKLLCGVRFCRSPDSLANKSGQRVHRFAQPLVLLLIPLLVDNFYYSCLMTESHKHWISLAVMAALGSGSGVGSTFLYMDKFSAGEMRAMQREVEYHMRNHPDIVNRFDRRLTRIEAQVELMMDE